MERLFKKINNKINGMIWSLVFTGIILIMLSILIVWLESLLRIIVGLVILAIAYMFIFTGYKLWHFKKDIINHFKF